MTELNNIFKKVATVAESNDIAVYAVGGYVRDLLLERPFKKDVDFVVVGSGLAFAKLIDEAFEQKGSLIEFPDFDTARYLIPQNEEKTEFIEIEFAGARSETYDPSSRKPKVAAATLEQDLARRDFTVNAVALPVATLPLLSKEGRGVVAVAVVTKHLIDPFNGQADLKNKILKTPLDPDVTFSDDPLRMLRATRFAAQLNFSIEPYILEAIYRNRDRIKIISGERVQEELLKLHATDQPSIGLNLLLQTHLLDVILPEVSALSGVEDVYGHQHKDNLVHSFKVADNVAEQSSNPWLRLAGLLHVIGKPGTKQFVTKIGWTFHGHEHLGKKMLYSIAKRLKFSKEKTDYLATLIRWHLQPIALMDEGITDSAVRRLVVTLGPLLDDLMILGRSDITTGNPNKKERRLKNYDHLKAKIAELLEKDKLAAFQSPVRGDEIMALCKLKPGPTVGKIKTAIEEAILDGVIPNEYEPAKAYFEKIKDEFLKDVKEWEKA